MADEIQCPNCGGIDWKAVEQFTSLTPCRLERSADGQVETVMDVQAEFQREASTSVITRYICSGEECGHALEPLDVQKLGG